VPADSSVQPSYARTKVLTNGRARSRRFSDRRLLSVSFDTWWLWMTDMDWRDHLVHKNGPLFLRDLRGRTYAPGRPAVGDGWQKLISIAIARIDRAAYGQRVHITQVKSTHGSVSILWEAVSPLRGRIVAGIENAVALARARSLSTCEVCGAIGWLWRRGDWLVTACDEHGGGVREPIPSGLENLHVVLGFADGSPAPICCRRYDRTGDCFHDIDASRLVVGAPSSLDDVGSLRPGSPGTRRSPSAPRRPGSRTFRRLSSGRRNSVRNEEPSR